MMTNHMKSLCTVSSGSTITSSPDLRVLRIGWECWYCSAHMGVTLALIPPVPRPIVTIAAMRPPRPALFRIAVGVDVETRITRPRV